METLVTAGADVNATSKSGVSLLMEAVKLGNLEAVLLLLKAGAYGNTVLVQVAKEYGGKCIETLDYSSWGCQR